MFRKGGSSVEIVNVVVGLVVLVLGRKLFWLFVGVVGFVAGLSLATQYLVDQPTWVILVIALAAGLVGALLAVFLQTVAIAVAGFIGGGYVVVGLLDMLGVQPQAGLAAWIPFIIGGIVGLVLALALFEWALIVLSSFVGATLVVQGIELRPAIAGLVFLVLIVVGFFIQAAMLQREEAPPPEQAV
jgi:hypothetical protein